MIGDEDGERKGGERVGPVGRGGPALDLSPQPLGTGLGQPTHVNQGRVLGEEVGTCAHIGVIACNSASKLLIADATTSAGAAVVSGMTRVCAGTPSSTRHCQAPGGGATGGDGTHPAPVPQGSRQVTCHPAGSPFDLLWPPPSLASACGVVISPHHRSRNQSPGPGAARRSPMHTMGPHCLSDRCGLPQDSAIWRVGSNSVHSPMCASGAPIHALASTHPAP